MAEISYVNNKGKNKTAQVSKEEYKSGYFHYHFNNSWWSSIQSSVESAANEELKKFIKNSARVPETNIGFKTPSGKEVSWLNLEAEDLKEISKSLEQTFNQSVRNNLIQGQNRISEQFSIFSSKNNNASEKTQRISELFDGIEQTLQYINAFSVTADVTTWNIFRKELTKNLLASNSKNVKTRNKMKNKDSIDIINQNDLTIVNSALLKVMERLQKLPKNIANAGGVYSKDSLKSFINGIIAEEISEVGIGQWTVEKINEQVDKAMSATFQHTGKQTNTQGKMQKADITIPLIKSQPFNLSLQRAEDKNSGLKLILKGDIGLSVKDYISEEKTASNNKGFFVGIHGGGNYMRELKTMFQGLSYTALGNTLIFSKENDATSLAFRLLRSAFLARKLEEALIGKGSGKADILVANGKYYFTSVLYRAAVSNIINMSQNTNQSQTINGNGIRVNFENIHHRSEADWVGDKKVKNIQQALVRNAIDRAKLYKLVYTIKVNPKTLIEKWLK